MKTVEISDLTPNKVPFKVNKTVKFHFRMETVCSVMVVL